MGTDKTAIDKTAWALIIAGAFMDSFSVTLIKIHLNILGEIDFGTLSGFTGYCRNFFSYPAVALAVITLLFTPLLPFIAISRIQLTLAYPVLVSLHLFFTLIFSHYLLHEVLEIKKALGMVCILASIFMFYRDSGEPALKKG